MVVDDASGGSKEAGAIGGLALLPLEVDGASRITAVKVDNLAMVDSVSIEVSGAATYNTK